MVNVGGDLRAAGEAPGPDGWVVAVEHPDEPERELARLAVAAGGVATTTRTARRWRRRDGGWAHHVIDPRSGRPASSGVVAVTVATSEAWWAEALAKAAFVAGAAEGRNLLEEAGAAGLLVDDAGALHATAAWERFRV
jgi:thiamine biosynthesis lipoprotein